MAATRPTEGGGHGQNQYGYGEERDQERGEVGRHMPAMIPFCTSTSQDIGQKKRRRGHPPRDQEARTRNQLLIVSKNERASIALRQYEKNSEYSLQGSLPCFS